jgi:hypothetical protein
MAGILSRYTTQIALIAYVVGGWLIPAAHDHGAHAFGGKGRHHVHGHTCRHAHEGHEHDTFEPEHCDSHRHGSEGTGSSIQWKSAPPSSGPCLGLCAICSARTLSKARPDGLILAGREAAVVSRAAVVEPMWSLPETGGVHFSRGPPTAA